MAQQQEIILTQKSDGEWELETVGFVGSTCQKLGDELADMLGNTTGIDFKPEHGLTPVNTRASTQQQTSNRQQLRG
jgi:Protein of unknown function (DUF2997)